MYKEKLTEIANGLLLDNKITLEACNSIHEVISVMNEFEAYLLMTEKKNWIAGAVQKPGSLHRALGVPQGQKIPKNELKVKATDSPKMKKRKILAQTLGKMHHK